MSQQETTTVPVARKAFNLGARKAADTAVMQVMDPDTGLPSGWSITFAGPAHPVTIAMRDELTRKNLKAARALEAAQANGKKWHPEEKDVDQIARENAEFLTARMLDWSPMKLDENQPEIPFSRERAIEFMLDPAFGWLVKQVAEFLRDDAAFMRSSAKT